MIEYAVKNKLSGAALENARLGGYAGRLAATFFEGRIFSDEAKETVFREAESAFSNPNDDDTILGYWRGEFWGKWVISAARVCRYTQNTALREFLKDAAHRLLSFQHENGYIGSYRREDFILSPDPDEAERLVGWKCEWCWNIWCRKYTLWGLLECYQLLDDPQILSGCVRMADHLIGQLRSMHLKLNDTGTFHGLPSGSIIKPMLILYRLTGDQKYLDLCLETAEDWDREDNKMPNLIANARSGKPVRDWYDDEHWAKAYEMMSCLDGLIELYRVTGVQKYFDTAAAMFDNLKENEMNAFYSVGFNDQFSNAARQINAISEPCDVIHWMRLCYELFTLTGELKYMDAFELASLNPFLAAAYKDGKWGSRALRSQGLHMVARQMDFVYNHCCVNNMPRGFMNMAEAAVMQGEDTLYINQFIEHDALLHRRDGQDIVSIRGSYTENCRARVTIDHQSPRETALMIRVPAWSRVSRVRLNGADLEPVAGTYLRAALAPFSVNVLDIEYDNTPVIIPFPYPVRPLEDSEWKSVRWCSRTNVPFGAQTALEPDSLIREPRCTLRMGPVLLARSLANGNTDEEMFSGDSVFGKRCACSLTPLPGDGLCRFNAHFTGSDGSFDTPVCDFASAANLIPSTKRFHSIWF